MVFVGRDHNDRLVPPSLLSTVLPDAKSGFPVPHPTWPWASPVMGHPQKKGSKLAGVNGFEVCLVLSAKSSSLMDLFSSLVGKACIWLIYKIRKCHFLSGVCSLLILESGNCTETCMAYT